LFCLAAHLNRILNDASELSVVPPPSPTDSVHTDAEVAAATSSMVVNADVVSISPSQSSENVAGVEKIPPYGPEMTAEIFRDYILNRMARSGPLESLPGFNVPMIPQYEPQERRNGEKTYHLVNASTGLVSFPQPSEQVAISCLLINQETGEVEMKTGIEDFGFAHGFLFV
ncbi:hypothetical protein ANCCAN_02532, partial [Ancylostoma caninum]